jgi:4'-phosphopantetheinyl transferase
MSADLKNFDGILPKYEIHVWHANLAVEPEQLASLGNLLDSEEQAKASRFKVSAAREQFVASHAFLRLVLARYLQMGAQDVRFRIAAHAKPELEDGGDVRFNLSHTDGAAVIAVARERAVGVDVERIRHNIEVSDLAERFFSPKEVEWLRSQPAFERIAAFFACWTAKEAYIKACGVGLSMPLSKFSVTPDQSNRKIGLEIRDDPHGSSLWSIWQLDLGPELRGAVAVQAKDATVRLGEWAWPWAVLR